MLVLTPNEWGPRLWTSIHLIAMGYPGKPSDIHKQRYKEFFTNLQGVIPCAICANNYKKHLEEDLPLTDENLSSNHKLVNWTIDLHNLVNKENGKKTYSYDEGRQLILKQFEGFSNTNSTNYTLPILIGIFIILIIIAIIYKKTN